MRFTFFVFFAEAEKLQQVAKITYDQMLMEKESQKRMSELDGAGGCCF